MSNEMISSTDLGKFVDWVWALKQERDELLHEREGLQNELKRLRALLAKPAEQNQGEPVAVMYADGSVLTKAECGSSFDICCKVETPLYTGPAEQPAPVAVVLPERNKASQNLDLEQCGYVDGWNTCLDEVARLNPPQQ